MKALPKRTKWFFEQFASAANKQVIHPLDNRRFYHFIQAVHQGRTKLLAGESVELLKAKGFEHEVALDLSEIYSHGLELLRNRLILNSSYNGRDA